MAIFFVAARKVGERIVRHLAVHSESTSNAIVKARTKGFVWTGGTVYPIDEYGVRFCEQEVR